MANLTGGVQTFAGDTSVVDTTKMHPLGTIARGSAGQEYMYCEGVASCLAGSWVSIGAANALALLTTGAKGPVGVAMAALVASTYGWVQTYGYSTIALNSSNGTVTSGGGELSACSTVPGQVVGQGTSTGTAAGDYIFGAFAFSGQASSADDTLASVFLTRPFMAAAAAVASS